MIARCVIPRHDEIGQGDLVYSLLPVTVGFGHSNGLLAWRQS